MKDKLLDIISRFEDLEKKIQEGCSNPQEFANLSKEYSDMNEVVEEAKQWLSLDTQKIDLEEIIATEKDEELLNMAKDEKPEVLAKLADQTDKVKKTLIPKDKDDDKNIILEIRAGTGGDEAALFASDLMRMYMRYCDHKGWKAETISVSDAEQGGVKEAIINIKGKSVFSSMKFESGGHRVQRVPVTESSGRIHTSAATVAILPEAEEVDIAIEEKDLRIDFFRSSGPGGQSVNTTDSAVRITHIPSGLVVQQQDEKSQHKNRAKAMKVLRSRLYEYERRMQEQERAKERKQQVGSGDRSERIRTYNFPQGRVTDHRINLTLYKLDQVIEDGQLDELINALIADNQATLLAEQSSY